MSVHQRSLAVQNSVDQLVVFVSADLGYLVQAITSAVGARHVVVAPQHKGRNQRER
jgi:hypothetical protein